MGRTSRNSWSNSRHCDHPDFIPGRQRKIQPRKRDPRVRPSCVTNARRAILQAIAQCAATPRLAYPSALHRRLFRVGHAGALRGRQRRRRRRRRLDDHRRKSASVRARRRERRSPPLVDEARADILATRHIGDNRAGLFDRRQDPSPIFIAPAPAPLAARDQCHPNHAVQLASLIKTT